MSLKHITEFIKSINQELFNPPSTIIEDYILDDYEIPPFFKWDFDYQRLLVIHKDISLYLEKLRDLIETEDVENSIYELLKLKLIVDNLIQNHKKDGKKNVSRLENFRKKEKQEKSLLYLKFHTSKVNNKMTILLKLYRHLINKGRLDKSKVQRKAFISLFFEDKETKTCVLWYEMDTDLRAFITSLVNLKIITYDLTDINKFVVKNFKNLNQRGKFKIINPKSFKGYQDKDPFKKALASWEKSLQKIFE